VELRRDDLARAAGDGAVQRAERLSTVEREIRQAQAEALGRTGERLQNLLDRLAELDRRLDAFLAAPGEPVPDRVRAETDARNRLRDDAMLVRHHLIIQREALGLARQTPVEQCYPVPERRGIPGRAGSGGREP
jgi:BMFP domain-containing protein YqiC